MYDPSEFYHIYNQGNNKQRIFFDHTNYTFFLRKARETIGQCASILSYCLMPNHFHFLVFTNEASCVPKKVGGLQIQALSDAIRKLQSHYAQGINQRFGWSGSLFRQRTKSKRIAYSEHALYCMNYIHQNPLKAGLVKKLEDWPYSSFRDYAGLRGGTLCHKDLTFELLDTTPESFYIDSNLDISPESLRECF